MRRWRRLHARRCLRLDLCRSSAVLAPGRFGCGAACWTASRVVQKKKRWHVQFGTSLFLRSMLLLIWVDERGGWTCFEHPWDRGAPYPSFFASQPMEDFRRLAAAADVKFHQCLFGARFRKPTQLATPDRKLRKFILNLGSRGLCDHSAGHPVAIGLERGRFCTAPLAAYPPALSQCLAEHAVAGALSCRDGRGPRRDRGAGPRGS